MEICVLEQLHMSEGKKICKVQWYDQEVCAKIYEITSTSQIYYPKAELEMLKRVQSYSKVVKLLGNFEYRDSGIRKFVILMELCTKGDLLRHLYERKRKGRYFRSDEILRHIQEFVHLLKHLQEEQICHRDIKPENIFVTDSEELKLGDFGEGRQGETCKYTLRGTLFFLSPKLREFHNICVQSNKKPVVNHNIYKSDVYSLGLVFLCMVCLESFNDRSTVAQQINEKLERVNESVLKDLILRMIEEEEEDRPDFVELDRMVQGLGLFYSLQCNPNPQQVVQFKVDELENSVFEEDHSKIDQSEKIPQELEISLSEIMHLQVDHSEDSLKFEYDSQVDYSEKSFQEFNNSEINHLETVIQESIHLEIDEHKNNHSEIQDSKKNHLEYIQADLPQIHQPEKVDLKIDKSLCEKPESYDNITEFISTDNSLIAVPDELDLIDFSGFQLQASVREYCFKCRTKFVMSEKQCVCLKCKQNLCIICKLNHPENIGCVFGFTLDFICKCGVKARYNALQLFISCQKCGEICRVCLENDTNHSHLSCARSLIY